MTVAEYLEMERKSEIRHEYVDGYIRAMSGETPRHNRIAGNVYRAFENRFENQPCSAYIEGIRVRVTPTQYRYPDIVALCGEEQFDNDNPPALLNPSVLVEVLSPSTQEFDRREKFIEYRQIAEMTDYLLIGQDQILVIHYARQSPTQWMVREYAALTDSLTLASLDVTVTLGEIYRKVSFEAPAGGAEEKGQEAKTQ
jgi:Uma2 family endonuclease